MVVEDWACTVRITWPISSKRLPIEFCSLESRIEEMRIPIIQPIDANSIGDKDARNEAKVLISESFINLLLMVSPLNNLII